MNIYRNRLFSTYSIVARDATTKQFGVAVQTHQMCVGAVVPWLLPYAGAIATQASVNISFGPMGLAMLREGVPAPQIASALVASDPGAHSRQFAVIDAQGRVAAWTGDNCIAAAGHHTGEGYSVQANMMTRDTVVAAMAKAYEQTTGDLAERMMAALNAAQREDGDIRGMQSAALKIVEGDRSAHPDLPDWHAVYDLRVDEHADPLRELDRLAHLRGAQLLDGQGYEALEKGDRDTALEVWRRARDMAPELEELGFWQAVTLADGPRAVREAADIFNAALRSEARRSHWIDLIQRLQACGMIKRRNAADELIAALG